ncbi:MAG: hypothetical protein HOL29_09435 [Euryarchaeota archaeon]|jgi:hypothetical protein|nr:hypothetical protein [Euryarchaeota archaeon]
MLSVSAGVSVNPAGVGVRTTSGRGFTPEELAKQCVEKIIAVSDTAPPAIRDQAVTFGDRIESVILQYMQQVVRSDRTTVYNAINEAGHPELAELIRRL